MQSCTSCGALIPAEGSSAGLCPRCLLEAGLGTDPGEVVVTDAGAPGRAPAPTLEELAPHFPDLELLELVGQGGMGAVYRVRQTRLRRDAALKVLTLDATAEPGFANRFEREACALAALSHPNLVTVYDHGQAGPWYYILMEYVDGATVRQVLRAEEVQPPQALSIVGEVCDALQYAHDKGVVHRDVKPENILVTQEGRVKILDFGLAKLLGEDAPAHLTVSGQTMGTPHYMAPEQWEHPGEVDHRADIFSLGVVFYELLTGELPVGRFPLPSQKVGVDERLDEVVLKALEKEPSRRYQQASQVKTDAQSAAAAGPPARPQGVGVARTSAGRSRPGKSNAVVWLVGCGGGMLLLIVAVAIVSLLTWNTSRARQFAEQMEHEAVLDSMAAEYQLAEGPLQVLLGAWKDDPRSPQVQAAIQRRCQDWVRPDALPELESFGPRLDDATASALRLEQAELERLRGLLAAARTRYLELETEHTRLGWTPEGNLIVTVDAFPDERLALITNLRQGAHDLFSNPSPIPTFEGSMILEHHFEYGESAHWLSIRLEDGKLKWTRSVTEAKSHPLFGQEIEVSNRGYFPRDIISHARVEVLASVNSMYRNIEVPSEVRRFWEAGLMISAKPAVTPGSSKP